MKNFIFFIIYNKKGAKKLVRRNKSKKQVAELVKYLKDNQFVPVFQLIWA